MFLYSSGILLLKMISLFSEGIFHMNIQRNVQNSGCKILFFYILIPVSSIKQHMFTKVYEILLIFFYNLGNSFTHKCFIILNTYISICV